MQSPLGPKFNVLWGRVTWKIPTGELRVDITPDLRNNVNKVVKRFKIIKLDSGLGEYNPWMAYAYILMAVVCVFIGFILLLDNYNSKAAKNKMG